MSAMQDSTCDQCEQPRSIVSSREVCRDCAQRDRRLDQLTYQLWQAVREGDLRLMKANADALLEYYG